jgi:predicted ester cyclase
VVASEWSATGTHTGSFLGVPPTGRAAVTRGVSLTRLAGFKIVEERVYFDRLALLQQFGVAPGAPESAAAAARP